MDYEEYRKLPSMELDHPSGYHFPKRDSCEDCKFRRQVKMLIIGELPNCCIKHMVGLGRILYGLCEDYEEGYYDLDIDERTDW